jgi:OOP family OmpA-OmpF porin
MADIDILSSANQERVETDPSVSEETFVAGDDVVSVPDAGREERPPPFPDDADLIRLRKMLFSREMDLLEHLRKMLEDPQITTRIVSEVLAEAVHLRSGKDPHLSMALGPVVDAIVKTSLNTRRSDFVNALSPLMGPTIRKSIAESFRSMMGNFSKSVEMAFSWKGLRWRFEAVRSGKPFSEIVMLKTLVYRVEQLFFIHSNTGLVLSHVAGESVEAQDADMISAMLTAIQDFVRDCFAGGKDDDLHSLQMGEFTIHIETGAYAYLACVMRGTPPAEFHSHLRATLDLMHIEYGEVLEAFQGDTGPFAGSMRYLESCLLSHYVDKDKKLPLLAKILPVVFVLAILAGAGLLYRARGQSAAAAAKVEAEQAATAARRDAFVAAMRTAVGYMRAEPGLVVADVVETPSAPWEIIVMKDALARPPGEVLRAKGVDPGYFSARVIPYVSYDPSIVVRRVQESIRPPGTVSMHFDEKGTLTFTGSAPMSWIVATRNDARAIPGVRDVDVDGVRDPMMEQISAMIAEVENTVIEFPFGRDTPLPADMPKLKKAIDTLVELENITNRMGFSASLTIYGHADSVGDDKRNYEISQSRARTVAGMLYAKGSGMPVAIYGMGAEYPKGGMGANSQAAPNRNDQASRRIELRVHFALSPTAKPEMFRR